MRRHLFLGVLSLPTILVLACAQIEPKDLSSGQPKSNIQVTESNGSVTGQFSKDATEVQRLVASKDSKIKGTYLEVMPGTLNVDTEVTIQEGADITGALLTELGQNQTVVTGPEPVLVTENQSTTPAQPMTVMIPIPLDAAEGDALKLLGSGKVGYIYLYRDSTGAYNVGFKALTAEDLEGTKAMLKASGFG